MTEGSHSGAFALRANVEGLARASTPGTHPYRCQKLPPISRWGFLCGSDGKVSACNAGDLGSIPGLGKSPGEGKGYPLQYSGLEKFHGLYSPWGHKDSDTTEQLSFWPV